MSTTPHSEIAERYHPFGFLPTFVIHEIDGKKVDDILLRESHAIVRFIDRIAPEPGLHISAGEGGAVIEEKMWEMVSLIAFLGRLFGSMLIFLGLIDSISRIPNY